MAVQGRGNRVGTLEPTSSLIHYGNISYLIVSVCVWGGECEREGGRDRMRIRVFFFFLITIVRATT